MHDNIFAAPRDRIGDFSFDDTVANVFPDMIKRSVPGYSNIVSAIGMYTAKFSKPGTKLYDLGCSLGACSIEMNRYAAEGCEVIGEGANGIVYRTDPDTIVKVYKNHDALEEIHNERELARKAFVLGIPTAIPYDVVRVGEGYGSVFELLNAKSFAKIIT